MVNDLVCSGIPAKSIKIPSPSTRHLGDLSPVLNLLKQVDSTPCPLVHYNPNKGKVSSASLGDFDRLWNLVGKTVIPDASNIKLQGESATTTDDDSNDDEDDDNDEDDNGFTPSSSAPDENEIFSRSKEVKFVDADNQTDEDNPIAAYVSAALRSRAKSSTKSRRKHRRARPELAKKNPFYNSEFESEPDRREISKIRHSAFDHAIPKRSLSQDRPKEPKEFSLPDYKSGNLPILWVPPNLNQAFHNHRRHQIYPFLTLSAAEKRQLLANKLTAKFGMQQLQSHASNKAGISLISQERQAAAGIHVFVDLSNILIGFYNELKRARGLEIETRLQAPPICFENLAMILERGRPASRRILAGSRVTGSSSSRDTSHLVDAAQCGYELNILERVSKPKEVVSHPTRHTPGNGYGTSSGSEGVSRSTKIVMTEQGVDEILHMKLLETIVDYEEPSTIVLASGDAAEAEYSSGFRENVIRALKKGWKVEVCSWRNNLGHGYRKSEFLKRWANQFTFVELDDYAEELLAIYPREVTQNDFDMTRDVQTDSY